MIPQDVVEADDTTPHREASISGEIVIGSHKARKARYADRFFADMVHRACLLCLTGRGIAVDKASMQGDIPERAAKALAISGMGFDSGVDGAWNAFSFYSFFPFTVIFRKLSPKPFSQHH